MRVLIVSGYSGKAIKPIALRFINDLAQSDQLKGIPVELNYLHIEYIFLLTIWSMRSIIILWLT